MVCVQSTYIHYVGLCYPLLLFCCSLQSIEAGSRILRNMEMLANIFGHTLLSSDGRLEANYSYSGKNMSQLDCVGEKGRRKGGGEGGEG